MIYHIMSLQQYFRSFLKTPYSNAELNGTGRKRRKRKQRGGKITRFGATLSGNPNPHVLYGSPTGGADGILTPSFRDPYYLGGRKSHHYHGRGPLMNNYINPNNTYHTYPMIGTTIY